MIVQYPHLPAGPAYPGERPSAFVSIFWGYSIRASVYERGFRVFKNSENLSKVLPTLSEARRFVLDRVNKKRTLF